MRKIYYIKNLVATKSSTNGRESTIGSVPIGRDDCIIKMLIYMTTITLILILAEKKIIDPPYSRGQSREVKKMQG